MKIEENHERYLKIISKSGLLRILIALSTPMRFSDLVFEVGMNPGAVDRNLKALIMHSLVERKENKYFLTEKGRKLVPIIEKLCRILDM